MIQDKKVPPWNITCSSRKVKLTGGTARELGEGKGKWGDSSLLSLRELRSSSLAVYLCPRAETCEGAAIWVLGIQCP